MASVRVDGQKPGWDKPVQGRPLCAPVATAVTSPGNAEPRAGTLPPSGRLRWITRLAIALGLVQALLPSTADAQCIPVTDYGYGSLCGTLALDAFKVRPGTQLTATATLANPPGSCTWKGGGMSVSPSVANANVTVNGQVETAGGGSVDSGETWSPAPAPDVSSSTEVVYNGSAAQVVYVWQITTDTSYPPANCNQLYAPGYIPPELIGPWAIVAGVAQDDFYLAQPFRVYKWTATHDFNADGSSDVLWRDTSGNVAMWEMNGTSVLNPNAAGVGNVPTTWSILGQRDFDGDGYSDILWHDTSGNVAIWLMNGKTVSNPNTAGVGNVATTWSIVGTGDFNGDSYGDILWHDASGDVAIWLMNGTTVMNPNNAGLGNVAPVWQIAGTGDFNADSQDDILWRNTSTGDVAIWLLSCLNGTTVESFVHVLNPNTAGVGNVATTWSVVGTGDFNGDGKVDILWRDTSGNVAIWLMNGTTILNPNTAGVGKIPTTWSVVGTGDYNNDGTADILWRDTSGNVAIWEMNGTTVLNPNTAGVGNVPTTWTIQGVNDDG
jgi:hypothetical protein